MPFIQKPLNMAQNYISSVVSKGDVVVDATAGNGNDTIFLAEIVGSSGTVYAFDIQEEAIERTGKRLEENNLLERVNLIQCGHEHIDSYLREKISSAMFNLGYLPRGCHNIITRPETTLAAIETVLEVLVPGGIVTIVMYCGHEGGREEKYAVLDYCKVLSQNRFISLIYEIINQINDPPSLLVIEKLK